MSRIGNYTSEEFQKALDEHKSRAMKSRMTNKVKLSILKGYKRSKRKSNKYRTLNMYFNFLKTFYTLSRRITRKIKLVFDLKFKQ